jgi:hypothetical protein
MWIESCLSGVNAYYGMINFNCSIGDMDCCISVKSKKHKFLVLGLGNRNDKHKKAWLAFPKGEKDKSKFKISL